MKTTAHMADGRDDKPVATVGEAIAAFVTRANGLENALKRDSPECFTEQRHTKTGTAERVYWHYGYMVALRDVVRLLTRIIGGRAN